MHYTVQCQEEYRLDAPERDYTPACWQQHPHLGGFIRYPVEGTHNIG